MLAASVLWLAFAPTPAAAHADLLDSDPAEGAILATSPATISLRFNEDISALTSTLDLQGPSTQTKADVSASGPTFTITPRTALTTGTWALLWQIESADGHPISGVVRFSVGSVSDSPQVALPSDGLVQDRTLELFSWLSVSVALAGLLARRRGVQVLAASSACVFAGLRLLEFFERSGLTSFALGEFRAASAVLLAGAVLCCPPQRWLLPAALGLYATQGLFSGHHHLDPLAPLLVLLHPIHLAAAALWLAALLALLIGPNAIMDVRRISTYATFAVSALFPAALILTATMLLPLDGWGRWEWTITAKFLLAAGALSFGWWNHARLRALASAPDASALVAGLERALPAIRRRTLFEVLALVLVATVTASIATVTPYSLRTDTGPSDSSTAAPDPAAPTAASLELRFDDGSTGRLEVSPLQAGSRSNAMLFVYAADGTKLTPESASWELSNESAQLAGLNGSFEPMGDHLHGFVEFPVPGVYQFTVYVSVDTFTAITALVPVEVSSQPDQEDQP
jgi:copper transport protein